MEIVIDIPENAYRQIRNWGVPTDELRRKIYDIIDNGTPLPKGHGDLIDKEKLKGNINGWYAFMKDICKQPHMTLKQEEIIDKIDMMTPIIEADKESYNNDKKP